jgi:hypothetical protein
MKSGDGRIEMLPNASKNGGTFEGSIVYSAIPISDFT